MRKLRFSRSERAASHRRRLFLQKKTCPDLPEVAADKLAARTHAELVKVIGRKFILYRPFKDEPKIVLPK